nr:hypothetical protein GCM10017745_14610 [Saccharothrix mutabilis subsp. capreolus]
MMEPTGELALAAEFPAPDREQWLELVQGVLRKSGAAFDSLVTTTYDGIRLQPLYTADDTAPPAGFPGLAPFTRAASRRARSRAGTSGSCTGSPTATRSWPTWRTASRPSG